MKRYDDEYDSIYTTTHCKESNTSPKKMGMTASVIVLLCGQNVA
jgi:hypothetical protein